MFLEVSEIKYFFLNLGSCCHVHTWPQRADEMKSTVGGSFGGGFDDGEHDGSIEKFSKPTEYAELMKVLKMKQY